MAFERDAFQPNALQPGSEAKKPISAFEGDAFQGNAFQIGAPQTGGKVDYILSGANGTYNVTGQSATLTVARKLAGSNGTYNVTGQAATLTVARRLSGSNGTYNLTGQSATLTVARQFAGANGTYNLTGQNATLTVARKLAGSNGVYNLDGQNATLTVGRVLAGDFGSYTLTGIDALLVYTAGQAPFIPGGGKKKYQYKWGAPYIPRYSKKTVQRIIAKEERLESQVKTVEKKIEVKRVAVDNTHDLRRLERLKRQIEELNKQLLALLAEQDEVRKQVALIEEEEALIAYIVHTLH